MKLSVSGNDCIVVWETFLLTILWQCWLLHPVWRKCHYLG